MLLEDNGVKSIANYQAINLVDELWINRYMNFLTSCCYNFSGDEAGTLDFGKWGGGGIFYFDVEKLDSY